MQLCFHLGYPRTGTTFLQKHVFPRHEQINFLGVHNYLDNKNIKISNETLNKFKNFYFSENLDNDLVNKTIKLFDKNKINLISNESYLDYQNVINNFYDCKLIVELLNKKEDLELIFLITLRNQFDLIKSNYYHFYARISEFLKIKSFNKLINYININHDLEKLNKNFSLRLFFEQYNYNIVNNKLLGQFKNCKIKYIFFEDLKFNKNIFINDICNHLNLDKTYTENLFNYGKINQGLGNENYDYFISPMISKIVNNQRYINFKNQLPLNFRSYFKKFYQEHIVFSKEKKINDEEFLKDIVKKYYKKSNLIFFEKTKIINKYDY